VLQAPLSVWSGAVSPSFVTLLPNKRLKLAGAYRSKGSGVLCPSGHGLSSTTLALAGEAPAA